MADTGSQQRELYVKCFTLQLDELELLSAVFVGRDELRLMDECLQEEMRLFVEDGTAAADTLPQRRLNFTIAPALHNNNAHKYQISFELPQLYPLLEDAIVLLHSPPLNQSKELVFKAQLQQYLATLDREEPQVYVLLNWIQEFVDSLLQRDPVDVEREALQLRQAAAEREVCDFERLWIYSHHIKSSMKRQEIVQQARKHELSGFSLVGKPGIICVEGEREFTQHYWRLIKALGWQKISVRKIETQPRQPRSSLPQLRRFIGFTEFLNAGGDDLQSHGDRMNMREFFAYLQAHNCGSMKHELFGLN